MSTAVLQGLRGVGRYAWFVVDFVLAAGRYGPPPGQVMVEAWRIGWKSLPILLVISAFVGTNLALQGHLAFQPLGGGRLVGMFVGLAGVRELAPIIAASMVAAKAGTEMASQLGVMRIRQQVDALEVMAVNPLAYLVLPRTLAISLVLPALTTIAIFVMVGSGYLVAVHQLGLNGSVYVTYVVEGIAPIDFFYGTLKAVWFGLVISTVSCFFGFHSDGGPEGVGRATNRAVVASAVICVISNYFISELLYGGLG